MIQETVYFLFILIYSRENQVMNVSTLALHGELLLFIILFCFFNSCTCLLQVSVSSPHLLNNSLEYSFDSVGNLLSHMK